MVGESVRCRAFIGRQRELSALVSARKSLSTSSGSFVLISGDAGIGKSRLLQEFIALARAGRPRHVLVTECLQRAGHALGPIRSALRALLPSLDFAGLPKPARRALNQLVPQELPDECRSPSSGPPLEKDELFEALLELLRFVCAKRALIWTVEDIHWADDTTIDFLQYLAHHLQGLRLLVVATLRSDELDGRQPSHPALGQLQREPTLRNVHLQPLSSRELHALVEETLKGHASLAAHVVRDIEERSEGNPLFAEELVKDSLERQDSGRPTQLPLSIRAIITQRASGLSADEQRVLEYAAVLGPRFDPEILALVTNRHPSDIARALRKAFDLNLIIDDAGERRSCRFRHALTWQTVYEAMPAFEARILHTNILAILEQQIDNRHHIDQLAYHAWRSGHLSKSVLYNEQAGEGAFALRALPEAVRCFERALEAASEADDRARLYERIGGIERLQGRYKQACDAFESALNIRVQQDRIDDATKFATSLVGQLYNLENQLALPYAERFLRAHRAAISPPALDHLLVVCARVACAFYDFNTAERYLSEVSDPDSLSPNARLNYLIVQMMRHAYTGDADAWHRFADRVDDLLAQLSPENVVGIENALALTGIYLGANEKIERALEHAASVEQEWGFRGQRRYFAGVKAAYLFQRGRLAEAAPYLAEVAEDAAVATGLRVAAPIAASLAVYTGDDSLWRQMEGDLVREAREQLDNPDCLFLLGANAARLVSVGELERARQDLRLAFGALSFAAPDAMYVMINAARYLPIAELGRVAELSRVAARHAGGASSRANDAFVRGLIAARTGRAQEASVLGREAANRYAALGWPLLEAAALELAGETETARAIYEICGAGEELRRSRARTWVGSPLDDGLSAREDEIAKLIVTGLRNEEIAKQLGVSVKTIEKHISSVFRKLSVRSRSQLVARVAEKKERSSPAIQPDEPKVKVPS